MIVFVSSQVLFRRTGSWASAFQKFVTLSILRVAMMSSYTARTSALAFSYSMNPRVDMHLLKSLFQANVVPCEPLFGEIKTPRGDAALQRLPLKALIKSYLSSFCLPDRDAPAALPQVCKSLKFAISACLRRSWQTRRQSAAP